MISRDSQLIIHYILQNMKCDKLNTTTTNLDQHPSPKCSGRHQRARRHVYFFKFLNGQYTAADMI
jgi:hypothetical protein